MRAKLQVIPAKLGVLKIAWEAWHFRRGDDKSIRARKHRGHVAAGSPTHHIRRCTIGPAHLGDHAALIGYLRRRALDHEPIPYIGFHHRPLRSLTAEPIMRLDRPERKSQRTPLGRRHMTNAPDGRDFSPYLGASAEWSDTK